MSRLVRVRAVYQVQAALRRGRVRVRERVRGGVKVRVEVGDRVRVGGRG